MSEVPPLPLSRPVAVEAIPAEGLSVRVETTAAEREALRALNGLAALEAFGAELTVRPAGRDGVRVEGAVAARVIQTCVVSLEPFPADLREPVEVLCLTPAALARWRAARAADPPAEEAADEPDAIADGHIDLGALAAEHLALGLDPYPRKPGVRFEEVAPPAPERDTSPFAVLKALRPDDA